jgi:hypothetical protein
MNPQDLVFVKTSPKFAISCQNQYGAFNGFGFSFESGLAGF